jgi:hypothetical protein
MKKQYARKGKRKWMREKEILYHEGQEGIKEKRMIT